MQVNTKPFGLVDVDERQQIHFPYGLFGFETIHDYVLLDAAQQPFFWLQSSEVVEIAFVLIDPRLFRSDYELDIDPEELKEIGLEDDKDLVDFAIVTIPENTSKMTANLQGPVLINRQNKVGRQSISRNKKWKVRHLIMEELKEVEQDPC